MPVIINKLGAHKNEDAVNHVVGYMLYSKFAIYYNGRGVFMDSPDSVIESFEFTKKMFYKEERKQVAHLIIGSQKEGLGVDGRIYVAEAALDYFYQNGVQCFYVIHNGSHDNEQNCHIHLAVNTINYKDGKRLTEADSVTSEFRIAMEQAFENYKWHSVNDYSEYWEA